MSRIISQDTYNEALDAIEAADGNQTEAAQNIGISRTTLISRIKSGEQVYGGRRGNTFEKIEENCFDLEYPDLPSSEIEVEDLIDHMKTRFNQRLKAKQAREWMEFKMKFDGPYGLAFVGDPHMDDNGCNWPLLEHHIKMIRDTDGMFGIGLGDYTNNWSGYLSQKIHPHQETTRSQAWQLAEWFFGAMPWMLLIKGNHDCVSEDTEVNTNSGWKNYKDLKPTDKVLGINPKTGETVWQPILALIEKDIDGELNEFKNSAVNLACTDNHRILYKRNGRGEFQFDKALSIRDYAITKRATTRIGFPLSGNTKNSNCVLPDCWIRLAAWILTDGLIDNYYGTVRNIVLWQKMASAGSIQMVLDECEIDYSITYSEGCADTVIEGKEFKIKDKIVKSYQPSAKFYIGKEDAQYICSKLGMLHKEHFPNWVWDLDDDQFYVLLRALIEGDGVSAALESDRDCFVFYNRKPLIDQLQSLCIQHGFSASTYGDRLNIKRRTECMVDYKDKFNKIPYKGKVWCLSVPYENFLIRRGNKAHFTGNCWSMSHGTGDPLDYMKRGQAPLEDWEAKFVVKSNNGHSVRIWLAHNFKGHSQWNPLHGLMKKARFTGSACLYVAGDKHNWAIYQEEDPEKSNIFWAARARGYKFLDPHAKHLGFEEQKFGCTITAVVDPTVAGPECMYLFASVDEACEFLNFKREKYLNKD